MFKISNLFFVISIFFILVSCGEKKNDSRTILKLTRWGDTETFRSTQRLLNVFMNENPDIKVVFQGEPWKGYWQKLQTTIAAGSSPDIFMMHAYYINDFYKKGTSKVHSPIKGLSSSDNS